MDTRIRRIRENPAILPDLKTMMENDVNKQIVQERLQKGNREKKEAWDKIIDRELGHERRRF